MRHKHIITAVLLLLLSHSAIGQISTFEWQGRQREFFVHVPNSSSPMPVMFCLHHLGGNAMDIVQMLHLVRMSEQNGWIVVAPQALPASAAGMNLGTMWNAGLTVQLNGQTISPNSDIDDAGFLMALLDSMETAYNVNADSVFFCGFSMGGFMTHRMAIEHGDRMAAAVAVSGLITIPMSQQTPVAPVRLLHIHGTNDNVVRTDGSSNAFGGPMQLGLSVADVIRYWIDNNNCSGTATVENLPDRVLDGLRFVRRTYSGGEADVQWLEVIGGQHTWYGDTAEYDIDYLTEILAFLTGRQTTYGIREVAAAAATAYPNPCTGTLTLSASQPGEIKLLDMFGRTVLQTPVTAGTVDIDVRTLPRGIYVLRQPNAPAQRIVLH